MHYALSPCARLELSWQSWKTSLFFSKTRVYGHENGATGIDELLFVWKSTTICTQPFAVQRTTKRITYSTVEYFFVFLLSSRAGRHHVIRHVFHIKVLIRKHTEQLPLHQLILRYDTFIAPSSLLRNHGRELGSDDRNVGQNHYEINVGNREANYVQSSGVKFFLRCGKVEGISNAETFPSAMSDCQSVSIISNATEKGT